MNRRRLLLALTLAGTLALLLVVAGLNLTPSTTEPETTETRPALVIATSDPTAETPRPFARPTSLVCPAGSDLCLAGHDGAISRSLDGGLTWTSVSEVDGRIDWFSCGTIAKAPVCLALVGEPTRNFFLESRDGGETWTPSESDPNDPSLLLPENCHGSICFRAAPGRGELERSSDGGVTFTTVADPTGRLASFGGRGYAWPVPFMVFANGERLLLNRAIAPDDSPFTPDPIRGNGWWESQDGGLSWQQRFGGLYAHLRCGAKACIGVGSVQDLTNRSLSNVIVAGHETITELDLRWLPIEELGLPEPQTISSGHGCAPSGSLCAALLYQLGDTEQSAFRLVVSDDGGRHWRAPAQRFPNWALDDPNWLRWQITQLAFADDQTILLFDGQGRLWRSPDGGTSWGVSR